ncbi:hypothetical protein [uncultured Flavobacterium sp.]|uniref:hypothetical protein n=1 Tax=uncultured Flavobacterium sp. TaxID=165435 RepID=UPI0026263B74|nr:hypothetical protein [uncultured Flavobacterium sp.]
MCKKSILSILLLFIFEFSFSQVGIATVTPEATLDVRAKNHTTTPGTVDPGDGILVPRVNSLSVNGTVNGQLVYLIADSGTFTRGFHYWNGTAWIPVSGIADGDAWAVTGEDVTSNIGRSGSVAVGSAIPNAYAKLDVSSVNQGILIPRINLTSRTLDLNSDGDGLVSNQPVGLIIYNIGTIFTQGLYFWNGTEWRKFDNSSLTPPAIATLLCSNATLEPQSYTSGTPYVGNLKVPYTGGNGGTYDAGATVTVNGLQFVLRAGTLNFGSGELIFSVTGTPTVSSPTSTSINIQGASGNNLVPFLTAAQSCTAVVGNSSNAEIKEVAFAGPLTLVSTPRVGYEFVGTTPDGKFSARFFIYQGGTYPETNVQLRYNTAGTSDIDIIQNTYTIWNGAVSGTAANNQVRMTRNAWVGQYAGSSALVTATVQNASNFTNWGDPGVYYSNLPEIQYVNWSSADPNDKTFYQLEMSIAVQNPVPATVNVSTCPGGTCNGSKAYIRIRQVKAF